MGSDNATDYYELLQISPNAEPETIHRVYRLLAQQFHPDNGQTGDANRFRAISEAYRILSDPERRAEYDVLHQQHRRDRWRVVSSVATGDLDAPAENAVRLAVLEILYARRRIDPQNPGLFPTELEDLTGRPREHLQFTLWYLTQKKFVVATDNSQLAITIDGVDYLEDKHRVTQPRPLLEKSTHAAGS